LNPKEIIFGPDALDVLSGIGSLAGTAIRHAQLFEELQAAHQRYHELFQDNIDAIFITDWEGRIVEANHQAEVVTCMGAEALQNQLLQSLSVINQDILGEGFSKLKESETVSYETTLQTEFGHSIPVHVYVREVRIDGISYLQWILHDITERKRLETLRNDLISMIYHDLRSPLANVVSSLDVLETLLPLDDDPALKSLLNIAVRSTERIQRLTNSLLDMRRLEAGQPLSNPQAVEVPVLIEEAIDAVETTAHTKHQVIQTQLPVLLPEVWADADMIRRVLINLLENAIKYTPQGSQITVGAELQDTKVMIWVKDSGMGIPLSEQERIFDKFTRLHSNEVVRGFGLGLAYCRLAVEAHGGKIWVDSQPGEGACFCFTLPVYNSLISPDSSAGAKDPL
jgi:PAS domain S-box-containing protein